MCQRSAAALYVGRLPNGHETAGEGGGRSGYVGSHRLGGRASRLRMFTEEGAMTTPPPPLGAAPAATRKLRRDVGMVGLLFASVGSIIGSGWLFGALNASLIAGPASLISWVIGGAAVLLLALIHAELGGMYPVAGGSARFPHYAFGSLIGFSRGWGALPGGGTTAPIEVEAALTYAGGYVSQYLHVDLIDKAGLVTAAGFVVAVVL